MIRDLRNTTPVPSSLDGRPRRAVDRRNWLVHSYFWDRAVELEHASGREAMIAELQQLADFFKDLDGELVAALDAWMTDHAITQQQLNAAMHEVGAMRGFPDTPMPKSGTLRG